MQGAAWLTTCQAMTGYDSLSENNECAVNAPTTHEQKRVKTTRSCKTSWNQSCGLEQTGVIVGLG
jgi:hypothetical protein